MTPRRPLALVAAIVGAISLAGCVPEPAPTRTPTGFASEEEAFAAAEETYRAYIEALNARNAGDEEADPKDFVTGEALDAEIQSQETLEESGRTISGETTVRSFVPKSFETISDAISVSADVCLDASKSSVLDAEGNDVTPEDVVPIYVLEVTFSSAGEELKITTTDLKSQGSC